VAKTGVCFVARLDHIRDMACAVRLAFNPFCPQRIARIRSRQVLRSTIELHPHRTEFYDVSCIGGGAIENEAGDGNVPILRCFREPSILLS
jgi:hypothetical protein